MTNKVWWIALAIAFVVILSTDLVLYFSGHETISGHIWALSATSWGRLIPFSMGFLSCHLLLGRINEG